MGQKKTENQPSKSPEKGEYQATFIMYTFQENECKEDTCCLDNYGITNVQYIYLVVNHKRTHLNQAQALVSYKTTFSVL